MIMSHHRHLHCVGFFFNTLFLIDHLTLFAAAEKDQNQSLFQYANIRGNAGKRGALLELVAIPDTRSLELGIVEPDPPDLTPDPTFDENVDEFLPDPEDLEPSVDPPVIPTDEFPSFDELEIDNDNNDPVPPPSDEGFDVFPPALDDIYCSIDPNCVSQVVPDPHFTTWNGDRYDFHNECDMVHVTNDHLDLHIRTEAIWSNGHYWSGVVLAALRFDDDILEVNSLPGENKVSVNGVPITSDSFTLDGIYPVTNTFDRLKKSLKSTEKVRVKMSGGQYVEFLIHLDTIVIRMDAHGSDFSESRGMVGYWNKPGLVGRDGVTSYDIPAKKEHSHQSVLFAMEWEVDANRGDPILFSTPSTGKCADTPQAPPLESEDEERRLVDMEFANELCDRVVAEGMPGREECIFDVLRSNFDEDVLENPAYTDPLTSIERCVAVPEGEIAAASPEEDVFSCADLGGKCVYRCNTEQFDCRPDIMCVEATDLTVVDAARRRMRKVDFIEGCSCALPKMMKMSQVADKDTECVDDPEFEFAIADGVRGGKGMKKCEWLTEMEGRADRYCDTKGYDRHATTMIKSACRGACAEYLSECDE